MTPHFSNPYDSVPPTERTRSTLVLPNQVLARIRQVHPKGGIIQTTISILIEKLIYELDRANITDYDPGRYESAVLGARIVLGFTAPTGGGIQRSPVTGPATEPGPVVASETSKGNDGRGTIPVGGKGQRRRLQPAKPRSSPASGRGKDGEKGVGSTA